MPLRGCVNGRYITGTVNRESKGRAGCRRHFSRVQSALTAACMDPLTTQMNNDQGLDRNRQVESTINVLALGLRGCQKERIS